MKRSFFLFGGIKSKDVKRVYRLLAPHARTYWKWFLYSYLALFGGVAMNLLKPWPLKLILDHVLLDKPMPPPVMFLSSLTGHDKLLLLAVLSIGIVVIFFFEGLFTFARKYFLWNAGERTMNDLRQQVFAHLQMLEPGRERGGDLVVRLTSDITFLRQLIMRHIQTLLSFSLTFAGIVITMVLLDWQLTLLALLVTPPLYFMSLFFSGRVAVLARKKREKESDVASLVQETVSSKEVVQAFAREEQEKKRFAKETSESLKATLDSIKMSRGYGRAVQVIIAMGTALVTYFGARRALAGHLSPGDLIVFLAYLKDLYKPVEGLSELILDVSASLVCGERVAEILDTEVTIVDAPDAIEAPPFKGEVKFENVTFGYQTGQPILQNLSFRAKPGQTIALIGSSGTGKSTVVNLLLRFHDPWEGRILIDGRDIRDYASRSLREQISVVLQEPLLFRRTIRENIAYGKPDASLEDTIEAAKAAQAHDFIVRLPEEAMTHSSMREAPIFRGGKGNG